MSYIEKQLEQAIQTLSVIKDQGEDLSKRRHVIYFFYADDLDPVRPHLTEMGFELHDSIDEEYWAIEERHRSIDETGQSTEWMRETNCLSAERYEVIGGDWRTTTLLELYRLGEAVGVPLDGWQASVEAQESTDVEAK